MYLQGEDSVYLYCLGVTMISQQAQAHFFA